MKALRPPRHGVPQLVPRLHCRKGDRRSCRPRPCSEVSPEGHVTSYSQHRRTGAPRTTTLPKVIFKNRRGKIRVRLIVLKRAVPQQRAHSRVPHEPPPTVSRASSRTEAPSHHTLTAPPPARGKLRPPFRLYGSACSRDLIRVESHNLGSFATGSFRFAFKVRPGWSTLHNFLPKGPSHAPSEKSILLRHRDAPAERATAASPRRLHTRSQRARGRPAGGQVSPGQTRL